MAKTMNFKLTNKAIDAIKKQIEKLENKPFGVRIGLMAGGCNGFSYVFEWQYNGPLENDHVLLFDAVSIFIDPKSAVYLEGTELDFVSGISGHGFKFNNPNVKSTCGCKSSIDF